MMIKRQEIDDMAEINPRTGLPKHIYHYNHSQCNGLSIRGTFQMDGKKYHTRAYYYHPEGEDDMPTLEEAIEHCQVALDNLKTKIGYWEYLEEQRYRKRVRKQAKVEYRNKVSLKDNRQSRSVLENIRSGDITIRRI